MLKLRTFFHEMRELRTRKAKAMSRKRRPIGETVALRLPSGLVLCVPAGAVTLPRTTQPMQTAGLEWSSL